MRTNLRCPDCGEPIWDHAFGSKLAKCWGCGIAFDQMEGCAVWDDSRETLSERIARLSPYIDSTRFALTERDVEYDWNSGNHTYARREE